MKNIMQQIKALLMVLIIIVLACNVSGCATHSLNMKIEPNYFATSPWQEIKDNRSYSDKYRQLTGNYIGEEIVHSNNYARIILADKSNMNICREKNSIEILIPLGTESDVLPIIRDASPNQSNSLYPSKKVNIVAINWTDLKTEPKYILPKEKWRGYPANILLTDDGEYNKERVIKVAYHKGSGDDVIFTTADTSNLEWICRKKEESKVEYYFLYPFAIAFDVITSPIQIPGIIILMTALDPPKHIKKGMIYSAAFSPDGKYILASDDEGKIKLWDISIRKVVKIFEARAYKLVFSPDGKYFLSLDGKEVKLWDIISGKELRTFKGHNDHIFFTAFSPDGRYVLSAGANLIVWEADTGKHIQSYLTSGNSQEFHDVKYINNGKLISGGGHYLTWWNSASGKEVDNYPLSPKGYFRAFSPDGKYFLTTTHDRKNIILNDVLTKNELKTFPNSSGESLGVVFSPNGKNILVSGSSQAKLWNIDTGKDIQTFQVGPEKIHSIAFNADSKIVLSGTDNGILIMWDAETGNEICRFKD